MRQLQTVRGSWLETPLGSLLALSDEKALFFLKFLDPRDLESVRQGLRMRLKREVVLGSSSSLLIFLQAELKAYFEGSLRVFKTPLHFILGTPFQKSVWKELLKIPYGETRSYGEQSEALGKPTAYRAVANANGANPIPLIVPCHRVIRQGGDWGGYAGGIKRKEWLIRHERQNEM